ncbi:MAG TPA: hypothetical protein PLX35_02810 [Cyclobacteriaceae bacterium]|nr:hypothetical protein [Cyclobacteriaceae bacterium]
MRYQKFPASSGLEAFVKYYFICESDEPERHKVISPPNCFTILAFNYGEPSFESEADGQLKPVPRAMACGLFTRNHEFYFSKRSAVAGMALRASALHNFFEWNMPELVDHWIPLTDILGSAADYMFKSIESQNNDVGRIKVLEHFASSHFTRANARISSVNRLLDLFEDSLGETSFQEAARLLHQDPDLLEKEFLEKVGIWPDRYRKLLQSMVVANPNALHEQNWFSIQ